MTQETSKSLLQVGHPRSWPGPVGLTSVCRSWNVPGGSCLQRFKTRPLLLVLFVWCWYSLCYRVLLVTLFRSIIPWLSAQQLRHDRD